MDPQPDSVNHRVGHVVVVWHDITLVWGGSRTPYCRSSEAYWDSSIIQLHQDGIWTDITTVGHIPTALFGAAAKVINDNLYVACGHGPQGESNEIYKLNLLTWSWSRPEPKGTKPIKSFHFTSWVSGSRMFLFGGLGRGKEEDKEYPASLELDDIPGSNRSLNNQLVFYDSQDNSWHWPTTTGPTPSPRRGHAGFSIDGQSFNENMPQTDSRSFAFIFGGNGIGKDLDELLILDLETMRWEVLQGGENEFPWPKGRRLHSLTRVSDDAAILFGGRGGTRGFELLGDCWMLNINKWASTKANMWTRCKHHDHMRDLQTAVQEPCSNRVWLIGGFSNYAKEGKERPADHIRELTFSSDQTLKVLALESTVRNIDRLAPGIQELPFKLRLAVEAKTHRKYQISGIQERYGLLSILMRWLGQKLSLGDGVKWGFV